MEGKIHLSQNMLRAGGHTFPASIASTGIQMDVASFVMAMGFHFDSFVPDKDYSQRGVLVW
jgi:hypothetical protein